MQQDVNLVMDDFKNELVNLVNNSGLPIGVLYYIIGDLYKTLDSEYYNYINQARKKIMLQSENEQTSSDVTENQDN